MSHLNERICIDCHKPYAPFCFPNGDIAGGGRCTDCQKKRLSLTGGTREAGETHKLFQKLRIREPYHTDQVCRGCHAKYVAQHVFNVFGVDINQSNGLCPDCGEKQRLFLEKDALEKTRKLLIDKRESWRAACGIPPTYLRERFETWEPGRPGNVDKILKICEKYANEFPFTKPQGCRSLVLTSKIWGVGKSHLASSIAHRILDRWNGEKIMCPVVFVTEPDLFAHIRATYNRPVYSPGAPAAAQETEESIFKRLTWAPLLILDDIGKEDVDNLKFVQRYLFRLINGRYNNNKLPMVLTCNLTDTEFRAHIGGANEASLDRLLEACGGKFFNVTGKSYRREYKE